MATLGDMRTRIADELQVDATTYATEIDRAIFSAIAFYNDEDFWFLRSTPSTALFTATSAYDLLTLLPGRSQILNVLIEYNQDKQELFYRNPGEFASLQSQFTGDPVYWTVNADQLLIEPIPSRTFTAVFWYTLQRSMTASASASSVWTVEAEELIRLHAEVDMLTNRIKDFQTAGVIQGRLQMVKDNLEEKTIVRMSSRRIRPHL